MIMADVLTYFLLIVGTMLVFISFWLAAEALFPDLVVRARLHYNRPVRTTLIGLALVVPVVALVTVCFKVKNPLFQLLGITCIAVPVMLGLLGSSGLSQRVGIGLPSLADERQPWRRVLRGGIVLVLTFLLPFVGWFFLLPLTLISGFGAAVLTLSPRSKASPPPVALPTPTTELAAK
jgi:hypothetical protein